PLREQRDLAAHPRQLVPAAGAAFRVLLELGQQALGRLAEHRGFDALARQSALHAAPPRCGSIASRIFSRARWISFFTIGSVQPMSWPISSYESPWSSR